MALLTVNERKAIFKQLGFGEYNEKSILAFQKKYMLRKSDYDGVYGPNTDNTLRTVFYTLKYTKNFKPEEFRCECNGKYCCGYPSYMKPAELIHIQAIRDHWKKPITVTCGLRCKTWNSKLGGSIQNSLHMSGQAIDFYQRGVTDTLANRKLSIKWIKKQPNHHYTYGNGINSYGNAVRAPYMGNALHTDTNDKVKPVHPEWKEPAPAPAKKTIDELAQEVLDGKWGSGDDRKKRLTDAGYDYSAVQKKVNEILAAKETFTDKILAACKAQAEWSKNSKYKWQKNPTIEKSKDYETCVTFAACVGQRVELIPSQKYIWHDKTGKVIGATGNFEIIYPKNKKLKDLKDSLKAGDFVMDGDKTDLESGSHIFIVTGEWKDGCPIVWDNHSAQGKGGKSYKYTRNRPVIAIARPKVR